MLKLLRNLGSRVKNTPLHPQWFAFYRASGALRNTCAGLSGVVLDVGCAEARPRRFLPADAQYIGLDYYSTATDWYGTRPDLFADAQALPLSSGSVDHVLLLDVLEHIADPARCLSEIHRVLKSGGTLTIEVPFLYPIHDAPLDFHRWTRYGLVAAARRHGFRIDREAAIGHPLESAALNTNIALSKTALNWIDQRNPLALFTILLPLGVLLINCGAWLFAALGRRDDMAPYCYRTVWTKT